MPKLPESIIKRLITMSNALKKHQKVTTSGLNAMTKAAVSFFC